MTDEILTDKVFHLEILLGGGGGGDYCVRLACLILILGKRKSNTSRCDENTFFFSYRVSTGCPQGVHRVSTGCPQGVHRT